MRRRVIAWMCGVIVGCVVPLAMRAPVLATPPAERVPGELVVKFVDPPAETAATLAVTPWPAVNDLFSRYGIEQAVPVSHADHSQVYRLTYSPDADTDAILAALRSRKEISYAEPNFLVRIAFTPDDSFYDQQWNFGKIHASSAWDLDTSAPTHGGDPDIVVAVVDTGVAFESFTDPNAAFCFTGGDENGNCVDPGALYAKAPDFSSSTFTSGYDFVNDDAHPNDDNGHGTHVASTVAEKTDNGIGAAGLAFETTVMPIKVIARDGLGTTTMIAQGIDYARENGADIINLSLGTVSNSQVLADAITAALDAGIIVVAANGNSATSSILYPARYTGVIGVGATANNDANSLASYSNWGSGIDLVAPGGDGSSSIIQQGLSNLDENSLPADFTTFGYLGFQGTSMATPHVSAAAALLLAAGVAPGDVPALLQGSAEDIGDAGYDLETGYGLLDIGEALDQAQEDIVPPVTRFSISPSKPNGTNGYYRTKPTITLAASDDRSGVENIYYSWDNGTPIVYTGPIKALNGRHDFRYYAYDIVGNHEARHLRTIRVDTTPPVLTFDSSLEGIEQVAKRRYRVFGTVLDGVSGVTSVTVDGWPASVRNGRFSATVTLQPGTNRIAVRAMNKAGLTKQRYTAVQLRASARLIGSVYPGPKPEIRMFRTTGKFLRSFLAYDASFRGGVVLAAGDVDGDGKEEIVVGPMTNSSPLVRIFTQTGRLKKQFLAFDQQYRGGLSLAVCDTNNDGRDEIVVGAGSGKAPQVRLFRSNGHLIRQFFAFPASDRTGVTVACGDVQGSGRPEILTVPAAESAPTIRVFSSTGTLSRSFSAYPSTMRLQLQLATGNVQGDGYDEVVVVPNRGGGPQVRVLSGQGKVKQSFLAYPATFRGGVSLSVADVNINGTAEIIAGAGPGAGPQLRVFTRRGRVLRQFFTSSADSRSGITVGAVHQY